MRDWKSLSMDLGAETATFVLLEACVVLLWRHNVPLLFVAAAICAVSLARWHERFDVCFFLVIAVLGTVAEMVFVHFGVWQYANPTLMEVPVWFPLAFGTTGLIGGRLAQTITSIWDKASPRGLPDDRAG
jgi:uncharacterized membrane protein YoaT (DUF817 family)